MPIQRFLSLSLSLALLGSGAAMADQVILKNGDIISGTVVSKSGDTLTFNTPYAGDIKIAWNEISTLSTDKPVNALFTDDSYVRTSLLPAGRGNVRLQSTRPAAAESDVDGNVDAASVAANADIGEGKPAATMADANTNDRALGLNDILYLNPTPEESGRGYRYSARANLASSNTSGNSSNQQLHMDGELQKRARDYRYTLGGEGNRASDSDVTSVSNWRTYASYDSFYTPTDFVYIHGALENDKFKDIKLRSVAGVGYGYQVYESETTKLSLKGGPDLVSIDRYADNSEKLVALGWHIDFNHKLSIFPGEVFHIQDGYRGFNSGGDILLKTRTGLRIPLNGGFTATAQYNLDWESNPAPDRGNSDRQLLIGIGYAYN